MSLDSPVSIRERKPRLQPTAATNRPSESSLTQSLEHQIRPITPGGGRPCGGNPRGGIICMVAVQQHAASGRAASLQGTDEKQCAVTRGPTESDDLWWGGAISSTTHDEPQQQRQQKRRRRHQHQQHRARTEHDAQQRRTPCGGNPDGGGGRAPMPMPMNPGGGGRPIMLFIIIALLLLLALALALLLVVVLFPIPGAIPGGGPLGGGPLTQPGGGPGGGRAPGGIIIIFRDHSWCRRRRRRRCRCCRGRSRGRGAPRKRRTHEGYLMCTAEPSPGGGAQECDHYRECARPSKSCTACRNAIMLRSTAPSGVRKPQLQWVQANNREYGA
jgi:hypothetical protein